jgi:hypothetical protein
MNKPPECATGYPGCLSTMARLETKLDIALNGKADFEKRLRALERRDAYVMGACLVISTCGPFLMRKLGL